MSFLEIALIALISALSLGLVLFAWRKSSRELFSPLTLFSVLMLYYTVIGPLLAIEQGDVVVVGVSVRAVLWKGWLVSLVAYVCFIIGYIISFRRKGGAFRVTSERSVDIVFTTLVAVVIISIVLWIFLYGGGLSFLDPTMSEASTISSVNGFDAPGAVYLLQLINLAFGAAALALIYVLERKSKMTIFVFLAIVLVFVLFCLKSGFRYRLAWLAVGLTSTYYLWTGRRMRLWLLIPAATVFVGLMGLIGMTRNYWGGLSLDGLNDVSSVDFVKTGFGESGTFFTLSQVVEEIPKTVAHTTFDPLWVAITYPIPRSLWSGKPYSATLEAIGNSFGSRDAFDAGFAVSYYGEWYIAFGWIGVIVSSVLFGVICSKVWRWYEDRRGDKLALMIYSVSLGFVYVAFSRGLLAQAALNFCFSLLPLFVVYRYLNKAAAQGNFSAHPSELRNGLVRPRTRSVHR